MNHENHNAHTVQLHWSRRLRVLCAIAMLSVLAACGGGGGASPGNSNSGALPGNSNSSATVVQGVLTAGLVVPSTEEAAAVTVSTDSTGLVIANLTGSMQSIKTGQVVVLPANDAQGMPMGYTGIAEVQSNGSVKLAPASIGDVFKTLAVDFDSGRDGGQIAGLIVPKNGLMTVTQSPSAAANQTGLDFALCQLGLKAVIDIRCKDGALEGTITLEHPVTVKAKGSQAKSVAKLYATIGLSKFSAKANVDFDATKYASTGGFNLLKSEVKGDWSGSMGIKLDDKAFTAEIPAWSELIRSDGANIWDENTKIKFGKYFELSGLNGDDKKGLIPLGGIYITPASAAVGGRPFGGELTAAQLGQIKSLGIVLWIYIDLSGKLTLSGDMKFFEATGGGFAKGFEIKRVNGALTNTILNTERNVNIFAPRITGKVEVEQNIGLSAAVDILVAGVRPATVKATLVGVNAKVNFDGDGSYRWSPEPIGLEGSLCSNAAIKLASNIEFRAAVNAKLDVGWFSSSTGLEQQYGPAEKVWWDKTSDVCINSFSLPLKLAGMAVDPNDKTKTKVDMSFTEAYNNVPLRSQVGRWVVYEEGPTAPGYRFYDVNTSDGNFSQSLVPGNYTVTVYALHKDLKKRNSDSPLDVVQSSKVAFVVPVPAATVNASPTTPTLLQSVSFWISDAYQTIKSVLWNFGSDIAEKTAAVANGVSDFVTQAFTTIGEKKITATYKDASGNILGQATTTLTVGTVPMPTATITSASSNTVTQPGLIANNASTDDTTPTLSGTISSALNGQKVNVYDGDTIFTALAVVTGNNWTFTPAIPLKGGVHSFTVQVATVLDNTPVSARSPAYTMTILATAVTTLTPSEIMRTVSGSFAIAGTDLPTSGLSVTVPGDAKAACQTPTGLSASGFNVSCKFYQLGAQTLEVRSGGKVIGTVTVTVKTNVTGVTWTSPSTTSSGTVSFGETVTFLVDGVNLTADPTMGFAVQLCGASNVEVGTPSLTQRSFTCYWNNQAGAVAGLMPGVVKDAPGGQVLFDGWKVPVELEVASGTFNVPANLQAGTQFTVPAGASRCTFNASGTWYGGSGSASSADGDALYPNPPLYPRLLGTVPYFALIAGTSSGYIFIGSKKTVTASAGSVMLFQINEGIGVGDSYADNSGALSISYSCN